MDSPPMFDISRLDIWKVMMSCHLKGLGYKVYFAITKESYLSAVSYTHLTLPTIYSV